MRPKGSGMRESRANAAEAAGLGIPAGFWSPWGANTVSEAGVQTGTGAGGRIGQLRSYAARAARPNASALAKRLAGSRAIAMKTASVSGAGTSHASHCSRIFWTRLRVSSRQAKEQQRAKRVNIAADARLPKPILLGWRVGPRAKLDGIGISTFAPSTRDSQVNNHQRREGHAGIGGISHTRHDDVRRFKVAMDYRYPGSPAAAKPACSSPTALHKTGYSPRA